MTSKYRRPINKERALLDFSVPADHETVCEFIRIMQERYGFLSVTSMGRTILDRDIHMITLGNPRAEKSVLYVGAHHGAEWITTLVLLKFVNECCEYYKNQKQPFGINMQTLFQSRCLRIVPQLNPDGVDIQINGVNEECPLYDRLMRMSGGDFSKWQANARGVDLNHNYNDEFMTYKGIEKERGIDAGPTGYSGESPLSEPETRALADYICVDEALRMIITLHSQGEEIYYSSRGYIPAGAEKTAKTFSKISGYRLSEPRGASSYGGLTDWYVREFNKPSFTVECGKGENPLSENKYFSIYARIREMLLWAPLLI